MSILDDDLDSMLCDPVFAVVVRHDTSETYGHETDSDTVPDEDPYADTDALGRTHYVEVRTGTLPGIAQGDTVSIEKAIGGFAVSQDWELRRIHHVGDGRLQRLYLGKKK